MTVFGPPAHHGAESSRRGILAATAGLLAPGAVQAAGDAARPVGGSTGADLIGACRAFDALERRVDALYDPGDPTYIENDWVRDETICLIEAEQAPLVEHICALRAVTPEGAEARVRSLLLRDKGIDPARDAMLPGRPWQARMLAAVLRDLLPAG